MNDTAKLFADGRLHIRLQAPASTEAVFATGTHQLVLPNGWQAQLHIPIDYDDTLAAPLLTVFHGVSGIDGGLFALACKWADQHGALVLAQRSIGVSWDSVRRSFGVDVEVSNYLINWVIRRHAIDTQRIGITGFSDGASHALSLGLTNGDLFSGILAFSPGFMRPANLTGKPRIVIAHGLTDKILSVDCGRRCAQQLTNGRYDVHYHEFDGGHTVPLAFASTAFTHLFARTQD
jgi:poly(3-hydroxybutyrate) depolymerase